MEVRWPPRHPSELAEFLDFLERLNDQMREMRDSTALPRSAVTLPDEFDETVARFYREARTQLDAAVARGEELIEIRLAVTPQLEELARWAKPRMDLLTSLTRAGLVQPEWERPLKLLTEVFEAVVNQIPA